MKKQMVWQCKCGHVEHSDMPEDCPKCFAVGKFKPIPEDMLEEIEEEEVLSAYPEEEDED
jgi:hypothetical protein